MAIRLSVGIESPPRYGANWNGVTVDIGRNGTLVACPRSQFAALPSPGQVLRLRVDLPERFGTGPRCIYCDAELLRLTELGGDLLGLAFRIDRMQFKNCRKPLATPPPVAAETLVM